MQNCKIEDIIWKGILKARTIHNDDAKYEEGGICTHGGLSESKILQIYGTRYGSMVGRMAFEQSQWPEPNTTVANVTLPVIHDPAEVDLA